MEAGSNRESAVKTSEQGFGGSRFGGGFRWPDQRQVARFIERDDTTAEDDRFRQADGPSRHR